MPHRLRFLALLITVLLIRTPIAGAASGHAPGGQGTAGADPHAGHPSCLFSDPSGAAVEWPEQIGQDAFAALSEMRGLLTADPATD